MRNAFLISLMSVLLLASQLPAQELLLRGTNETTAEQHDAVEHAQPLPEMKYSHPELSADGSWAGVMTGLILMFFIAAGLIGVITDIDRRFDAHLAAAPAADSHAAAHGHGH